MRDAACPISDLEPWECAHCRGERGPRMDPTPRIGMARSRGRVIWPLRDPTPTPSKPRPLDEPSDDLRVNVARDLREIRTMAMGLGERALDMADHPEILGGDAMVNLAPVANYEAWEWQVDTDERLALAGIRHALYTSPSDEDPDDAWSPAQMLEFWSEQWRVALGKELDVPATISSEAAFLAQPDVLAWAWDNEPHFEDFATDARTARNRVENIIRDGVRETRSRIMCDRCNTPKRLIRKWGKHGNPDRWKAPCCKAELTEDEAKRAHAKQLRSQGAERWVERTEAIGALEVQGWTKATVRKWLADEVETVCEPDTRRVLVWWPTLWRRHLVEAQERAERERKRTERRMARDVCEAHHGPDCWRRGRCHRARDAGMNPNGVIQ